MVGGALLRRRETEDGERKTYSSPPACLPFAPRHSARCDGVFRGNARSLEGGLWLLTPLYASDGQDYAAAQGPLVLGGYRAGSSANSKVLDHPTVGRIPGGAGGA